MTTRKVSKTTTPQPILTATDIGEYAYCAKAWQLSRDGVEPEGEQLDAGTAYHRQHGASIAQASRYERAGRRFVGLAFLCILMFVLYFVISGGGR